MLDLLVAYVFARCHRARRIENNRRNSFRSGEKHNTSRRAIRLGDDYSLAMSLADTPRSSRKREWQSTIAMMDGREIRVEYKRNNRLSRIRVDVSDPTDDLCAILGSSSSAYSDYRYDMIKSRDDKKELRGFAHGFNTRRHEKLLGIRRNEKKFKTDLRNSYLASIGN